MKLWWLLHRGLIDPALARLISAQQVRTIFEAVESAKRRNIRTRGGIITMLLIVAGLVVAFVSLRFLGKLMTVYLGRFAFDVVLMLGILGIFGLLLSMWRSAYATTVFRTIRTFGHDVCPNCGYWLKALPPSVTQCPECGEKRESDGTAQND